MSTQNNQANLPEKTFSTLVNHNLIQSLERKAIQDELNLISVCREIGGIAESNNQYTLSLTLHIKKSIESLTVAELLAFHRECVKSFNKRGW